MCEMLNSLEARLHRARVPGRQQADHAGRHGAIKRALENQVKGLGFSFVEVLSPCPTIWKLDPLEAQRFVREEMTKVFPVGSLRDRSKDAPVGPPRRAAARRRGPAAHPGPGERGRFRGRVCSEASRSMDLRIRIAGFGGQGVLMLGEVLAEAGLAAGYNVSWLPSYGPEMRSGTSNCHVRVASDPVDSPLVSRPNVLLALNEPSLRKFLPTVEPGGVVIYNGESLPEGCERADLRMIAAHFTGLADHLGSSKAANIIMLGTFLEASSPLDEQFILAALRKKVKSQRWYDLDVQALRVGREQLVPA